MDTLVMRNWRQLLAAAVALALTAALLLTAQTNASAVVPAKNVTGFEVDTEVNTGLAVANTDGTAHITFLVTNARTQKPVTGLSGNIPTDAGGITLPAKVVLEFFTVAPGGCSVTPTRFTNYGAGVYRIQVVPNVLAPTCTWKSGDYLYAIHIKNGAGTTVGSDLFKLSVP